MQALGTTVAVTECCRLRSIDAAMPLRLRLRLRHARPPRLRSIRRQIPRLLMMPRRYVITLRLMPMLSPDTLLIPPIFRFRVYAMLARCCYAKDACHY